MTKNSLTYLIGALAAAGTLQAAYLPVPLTPGSFNADMVVEKTAAPPLVAYVSATVDGGTNLTGATFYERGYNSQHPWTGIPLAGTSFSAVSNTAITFRMAPNYVSEKNALLIGGATSGGAQGFSGVLSPVTPTAASSLSFLFMSGGGSNYVSYTITYQGGATQMGNLGGTDWYNTTETNVALVAGGRVQLNNGSLENLLTTTQTKMFYTEPVVLNDKVNPVTSISFSVATGSARTMIWAVSSSSDDVNFTPLDVTGFNHDAVMEVSAPRSGFNFAGSTATYDSGTNNTGYTLFEKGFNRENANAGLPVAGGTFTFGNKTFKMPASYTANNAALVYAAVPSVTLNVTPGTYTGVSLLSSSAGGDAPVTVTLIYQDGYSEPFNVTVNDWYKNSTVAYTVAGRYQSHNQGFDGVGSTNPRLFANDIAATYLGSPLTQIRIDGTSGNRSLFFAVSGQTATGGAFSPLDVTGFNVDAIVEASLHPFPERLVGATDASMDRGKLNLNNTWYEQGYYTNMPWTGFPAAGSTIVSVSDPDNSYQMPASYTQANAAYVDAANPEVNLVPVTPAWYSALSLLSSSGASAVTNQVIVQYNDGTSETNRFVSLDWFNGNPYAYAMLGRVDLNNKSLNNTPGHTADRNPRLYEGRVGLRGAVDVSNKSYMVTNINIRYLGSPNASARMGVFALSGSTGTVPPIIKSQPANVTTVEGSNVVMVAEMGGGTPPFAYQWQVGTNNVWVDMVNGGTISGVDTTSLVFSSIGWTNTASYRFIVAGSAGSTTSAVATVTVRSGLLNMARVGDPVAILAGTTPGGEPAGNAINRTTTKWLNYDAVDTAAPFVGPVGMDLTPSLGRTILSVLRFYTANDSDVRDPADYKLEGSNDNGTTWNTISSGNLALPTGRNAAGLALNPLTLQMQEVRFANATAYGKYRITFQNVRNNTTASSMQIGEIEFLGEQEPQAPTITRQPTNVRVYAGTSPTLSVAVTGYPTNFTYQWHLNGSVIEGATGPTYTIANVQPVDSGKSYTVKITNPVGTITSAAATLNVISAPTQSYPAAVAAAGALSFWRLNEGPDDGNGNNGVIANDYVGGRSGTYNQVVLQQDGYNTTKDSDKAVKFGAASATDSYVGSIPAIDFAAPTNSTSAFSLEAWVLGEQQTADAGIVTKGYGGGGEQFNLDTGSGANKAFRFFVRDSSGGTHGANGSIGPDGKWHHVVGVFDGFNGRLVLYVDGISNAAGTVLPHQGVLSSSEPVSIGSRRSGSTTGYNNQFIGTIDEVAIYGRALSETEVLNHYYAASPAPVFSVQPTNSSVAERGTATLYAKAYGPEPLTYQWFQSVDSGTTYTAMAGKTSSNLVIANVQQAMNGYMYQVEATNPNGKVTSQAATLSVLVGAPYVQTDIPQYQVVYAGRTILLTVDVAGSAPFTYQWQRTGVNLTDGGRVIGARSNVLAIIDAQPGDVGVYQLQVNNAYGSAASSPGEVLVQSRPNFNTNGVGWTLNGTDMPPTIDNNVITLTQEGTGSVARSLFYNTRLPVDSFVASWVYTDASIGGADGYAFVVQNAPAGPAALGGTGGALGYSGITPSVALQFNIYGPNTPGVAVGANGVVGGPYVATPPVDISVGTDIAVTLAYSRGSATLTLKDLFSGAVHQSSFAIDIPAVVGDTTAYVGFTAATGGTTATQRVKNFAYVPMPVLSAKAVGDNVVLTWAGTVGGFSLQTKTDLGGAWQAVTSGVSLVNGQYELSVPAAQAGFYRLVMP